MSEPRHELLVRTTQVHSRPRHRSIFRTRTVLYVHDIDGRVRIHASCILGLYVQRDDAAMHGGHKLEICKNTLTLPWPLGNRTDNDRSRRARRSWDQGTASPTAPLDGKRSFKYDRSVMWWCLLAGRSCRKRDGVLFSL